LKEIKRFLLVKFDMNELNLKWRKREGGNNRTERDYLDFEVDGIGLSTKFGDMVSCLGWAMSDWNDKAVRRLLLEESADFENNRRSLYVCPECGDLGCGAVSIIVDYIDECVIWKDFAYQNNYSDDLTPYDGIGTFVFEKIKYEILLRNQLSK
jgi:hypothetical protein